MHPSFTQVLTLAENPPQTNNRGIWRNIMGNRLLGISSCSRGQADANFTPRTSHQMLLCWLGILASAAFPHPPHRAQPCSIPCPESGAEALSFFCSICSSDVRLLHPNYCRLAEEST